MERMRMLVFDMRVFYELWDRIHEFCGNRWFAYDLLVNHLFEYFDSDDHRWLDNRRGANMALYPDVMRMIVDDERVKIVDELQVGGSIGVVTDGVPSVNVEYLHTRSTNPESIGDPTHLHITTDDDISMVTGGRLRYLSIYSSDGTETRSSIDLTGSSNIEYLRLSEVDDVRLIGLLESSGLRYLDIDATMKDEWSIFDLSARDGIEHMGTIGVTDVILEALPALTSLGINDVEDGTDLSPLSSMEYIYVTSMRSIQDATLINVRILDGLVPPDRRISGLDRCRILSAGKRFRYLSDLPDLRVVMMEYCRSTIDMIDGLSDGIDVGIVGVDPDDTRLHEILRSRPGTPIRSTPPVTSDEFGGSGEYIP